MGIDRGSNWPSGAASARTVIMDSEWSTAVGTSASHRAPIMAALWPKDICRDFDDFTHFNATTAEAYTITLSGGTASVAISTAIPHGAVTITSDASANTESSIQRVTCWNLHATKSLYFGARFNKTSSATVGGFVVGMTIVDPTPAGGLTDGIYFLKADGSASVAALTTASSSSTTTSAVGTIVADTNVEVGFVATSTSVSFLWNGALVATHTATIPATTVDLRANFVPRAAAAGTASAIIVDYHDTCQARTT